MHLNRQFQASLGLCVIACLCIITYANETDEKIPVFENDANLLSCNNTAMGKIIRWLFFFNDPKRILPRDSKEFDSFCDERSRKELYVNAYARQCLRQFPRQITSLLMFGIARQNRYYCNFTKGRADILQGAKCLNAIKKTGSQCMSTAISDLHAIQYAADGKVAKMCCTYYRLEECLVHKVQEETKVCSKNDPKRMEELLEGYTRQMIDYVCAKHPKDIDQCSKVLPKRELAKLRKLALKSDTKAHELAILQPMIDILDSIPP